ncbi:MAG: tRNA epoxyqueuosine(34) reductase QueG [Prevotellaceae bacterium]|nr:tRNA epoxyqueuosine(34) reductase QueG [Prevotellaceae bacterium]
MHLKCLNSELLKAEAQRLGFSHCQMAPAEPVPEEVQACYRQWLDEGRQADMHYLERYPLMRFNPCQLVQGVKTVVSLALSYHPGSLPTQKGLAWYAQGMDYHLVIRGKLQKLMQSLGLAGSGFTDTAPVLEKYWAWRCGLGFLGRHTQLVIPHLGSAFFLGELFLREESDHYDSPLTPSFFSNLCGDCHRCEQACPSGAISASRIDASRCLSYLTIENRGALPTWSQSLLGECFYGCDRCLRSCPHLQSDGQPPIPEFRASDQLLSMSPADWQSLVPVRYSQLFRHSAVKRAKYASLMRNIKAALG